MVLVELVVLVVLVELVELVPQVSDLYAQLFPNASIKCIVSVILLIASQMSICKL